MPPFTPKRKEQIYASMIAKVVARSELSDVGDSSSMKHALAAAARQDGEQYYQMSLLRDAFSIDKATGDDLDARAAEIQPGIIRRITSNKATGNVVFSRAVAAAGTINIPIGTKVKTVGGQVFTTTAAGSITVASPELISGHGVGRDSGLVGITADVAGATGNADAGTVIKFEGGKPAGVSEVTNLSTFANGRDKESDDAFRDRIRKFVNGLARSTVQAIEAGIIGQQDPTTAATVLFSNVDEDIVNRGFVTAYIDDGTGTAASSAPIVGENVTEGVGVFAYEKGIVPIPAADTVDGEYFTVDDGVNAAREFEFDLGGGGVTGGRTAVVYVGTEDASAMGALIQAAVHGEATIDVAATGSFPVVVTLDSAPTGTLTITENVADSSFVAGAITAALGGETRLYLENKPVKDSVAFTLTSSVNGVLTSPADYVYDPTSGQINMITPLVEAEVITADYTHYTGLIQYIQKVIDGDKTDRTNFPGLRAGGVFVQVLTPTIQIQVINLTVTVGDGYVQETIKALVKQAVVDYVNAQGISGDIKRAEIFKRVMLIEGVEDVIVNAPTSNVILLDDQLARTTTGNVTVS